MAFFSLIFSLAYKLQLLAVEIGRSFHLVASACLDCERIGVGYGAI